MKIKRFILTALFGWIVAVYASDQIPAPPQKQPIALLNATIHPVTGPVIEKGAILFDQGKIIDIGTNISVPSEAKRLDLDGKHVYPGLIETYSMLGLTEIGAVKSTRDYAEMGDINPNVRAEVAVNPESEYFPVTRANGIALAVTLPRGGLVAGKAALLRMDGWTWEDMTVKAPVGMVVSWPRMNVITSPYMRKSAEEQRKDIKEQLNKLEQAFKDAQAYKAAHGNKAGTFHKRDARLEALIPVLKGELPLWIIANSLMQIEAAASWADQLGVKMVLVGGTEAALAVDLLKRKKIPVIITSVLDLPSRRDADFDEPFTLPRRLSEAGVQFCIASASTSNARNLPYHAAKAAAYGLPKDEALKAITLYPAQILGVGDRQGSLEIGKDATLMITTGDPLEITTNVEKLFIQGRDIDLNNKHKTLFSKYQTRYRQMEE